MSRIRTILLVILLIFFAGVIIVVRYLQEQRGIETKNTLPSTNMQLTSPAFQDSEYIPRQYTCDGSNVNPPLNILDAPSAAKSLVLIIDDPDAPRGDWVHWTVWNIHPTTVSIGEHSVPSDAVEGQTDFGQSGYGGPCPPSGIHRYFFKLYALDTTLDLRASSRKPDIERAMSGHILDEATLVGRYQRR